MEPALALAQQLTRIDLATWDRNYEVVVVHDEFDPQATALSATDVAFRLAHVARLVQNIGVLYGLDAGGEVRSGSTPAQALRALFLAHGRGARRDGSC